MVEGYEDMVVRRYVIKDYKWVVEDYEDVVVD